jgi:hypothetical protein
VGKTGRLKTRTLLIAAALAGVSVAGATSASAATTATGTYSTFACTKGLPEICLGVTYTGQVIDSAQIQLKLASHITHISYMLALPSDRGGDDYWSASNYSGGPGWVPQFKTALNYYSGALPGKVCAVAVTTGYHDISPWGCVAVP